MSLPVPRRVVIDPNVLVSGAITPVGASARVIALIDSGALIAVASPKLVQELAAVLRRPKFSRYLDALATPISMTFRSRFSARRPTLGVDSALMFFSR